MGIYGAVTRPSNQNKKKAQILVSDVHATGMEHGRQTISLAEIEKDMMDDIEYKAYLHKKTYGVRNMKDVDRKFSLATMDSVCNDCRLELEQCLKDKQQQQTNDNNNASSMPYYDATFSS